MDKKHVCKLDGRQFKTLAALQQHARDSHGSAGSQPKNLPKGRKTGSAAPSPREPASMRGGLAQVMVAQPQRVLGTQQSDYAVMSGLDRILHISDVSTYSDGDPVLNFTVHAAAFKRLSKAASVFQRIIYQKLIFRIEPQLSAATSGGYVAGFVNDPDDSITTMDQLTSLSNSVTTKWWQASTVNARPTSRELYTAPGPEMREYSPGTFIFRVDGKSTQKGSLTLFCEWSVRLRGSVIEAPPPKVHSTLVDLYIRNGHQGLWDGTGEKASSVATKLLGSDAKAGSTYKIPYPVGLVKPNDSVFALHHFIYVKDSDSVFLSVNYSTDYYEAAYTVDNLVITKGTVLEAVVAPAARQGEAQGLSSLDSEAMTAAGEQPSKVCRTLPSILEELTAALRRLDPNLESDLDPSGSMESFSLMESRPE